MLIRNRSIERLEGARQSGAHLVDYLACRRCRQAHKPTARYLPFDSGNLNTGVPLETELFDLFSIFCPSVCGRRHGSATCFRLKSEQLIPLTR
jgi:hypothetical protein